MLLQTHHERWAEEFGELRRILLEGLHPLPVVVEHVGSTAIPHLAAKPILDIDVVYGDGVAFADVKAGLEKLGYQHHGDQGIVEREVFKRGGAAGGPPVLDAVAHHLYVCPVDSAELRRHLRFRDFLRADEAARVAYQQLKQQLAAEAMQDRKRYARLKEERAGAFIRGIVARAPLVRVDDHAD